MGRKATRFLAACLSLGMAQTAVANNPWPQPIEVPLDLLLAHLAVAKALAEFNVKGLAEPTNYKARVLQDRSSIAVWMFDMTSCQPSHGRRYNKQPILFVTLSADATTVIDSHLRHLLEC